MKNTLLTLVCLTIWSCGNQQFVPVNTVADSDTKIQLDSLDRRVSILETLFTSLQADLIANTNLLTNLITQNQLTNEAAINDINLAITDSQNKLNSIQATVAELTLRTTVSKIIDPCGTAPGYNEVLLRMSDGNLVAYFESGSNRFLSLIQPGSYRTTDGTNCNFNINNQKQVCYNNICE